MCAAAFGTLVGASVFATHPVAAQVELTWSGDTACIDEEQVRAEVRALRPEGQALSASIRVEERWEGYSAEVRHEARFRSIQDDDCRRLVSSLVVVLSLFPAPGDPAPTVAEGVARREEQTEVAGEQGDTPLRRTEQAENLAAPDEAELPADEPEPEETSPASAVEPSSASALWAFAGAALDIGTLTAPALGLGVGLIFQRGAFWLDVHGSYFPGTERALALGQAGFRVGGAGFRVGGRLVHLKRFSFVLAAGSDVGVVHGQTEGIARPGADRGLLWTIAAEAGMIVALGTVLRLRLNAEIAAPLVRSAFDVEGTGELHSPSLGLFRVGFFVEVRFWSRIDSPAGTLS